MPYKDPQAQKAASHRSYLRNKRQVKERQRARRAKPGYRDAEYAKRLEATSEEVAQRRAERESRTAARQRDREARAAARKAAQEARREAEGHRTPLPVARRRRESEEAREASENQRRLKAEAMRRMGFA